MYHRSSIQLQQRPDLGLLVVRWLANPDPAYIRAEYEETLATGISQQTAHWLMDVRRRDAPGPELAQWVSKDWLPRVVSALAPLRPRLAYLISPQRAHQLATDFSMSSQVTQALHMSLAYDVAIFTDEGEAMRWLLA